MNSVSNQISSKVDGQSLGILQKNGQVQYSLNSKAKEIYDPTNNNVIIGVSIQTINQLI